jgi:hypothetical protein
MLRFVPFLVLALTIVGTPVRTANRTDSWRWQMAFVDATREHLELRYGSSDDGDWDDWILVARVGRPVNRVFPVYFVLPDDDCENAEAREAVGRSLDYYLVELSEPDPWEYAIYHTMTLANMYSRVHWGWIRRGRIWTSREGDRRRADCGAKGADAADGERPAGSLRVRSRERLVTLNFRQLEPRRPLVECRG